MRKTIFTLAAPLAFGIGLAAAQAAPPTSQPWQEQSHMGQANEGEFEPLAPDSYGSIFQGSQGKQQWQGAEGGNGKEEQPDETAMNEEEPSSAGPGEKPMKQMPMKGMMKKMMEAHMGGPHHPPPPPKGAEFAVENPDGVKVKVKCDERQSVRECFEMAQELMEKAGVLDQQG
jgi:hypothetical protein